jgi:hypothetical protein
MRKLLFALLVLFPSAAFGAVAWRSFIELWYAVSETFGRYGGPAVETLMVQVIRLLMRLRESLIATQKPQPAPSTPDGTGPSPGPTNDRLVQFCTGIRDFEGMPGDLNYHNNNPGNCRCSRVGYLPIYGHVKCVNGFAVFKDYETGWRYLQNHVRATRPRVMETIRASTPNLSPIGSV